MRLNLKDYRASQPAVMKAYLKGGYDAVHELCVTISVPLVAACYYILEEYEDEKVTQRKEDLTKFYGYTRIVGEKREEES